MSDFSKMRALITGASEGIGACLAEVYAKNGHDLVLVARNEEKLTELAQRLESSYHTNVTVMAMDLIPDNAADILFAKLAEQQLEIDILVNNAGMMQVEPFCSSDMDKLERLLHLNIHSLVRLCRLFSGPMLARGKGRIVNLGSIASFMPTPNFAAYGASKAFVLSFSEGLAQELQGSGVEVTCVCPGFTKTTMLEEAQGLEKYIPGFLKADPMALAEQSYKAMRAGDVVFLDSLANKMLVQWARHYPKWMVRSVNGLLSRFG